MIRLDIGSGILPRDGFTGVDLYAEGPNVIKAPMEHLPFEDNTVEEIYSTHALEHVGKYEVVPALVEWHRVLRPGGQLSIDVPDMRWICTQWLQYQDNAMSMDIVYGDQTNPGQFHKTGFTPAIGFAYLNAAGFRNEINCFKILRNTQESLLFVTTK